MIKWSVIIPSGRGMRTSKFRWILSEITSGLMSNLNLESGFAKSLKKISRFFIGSVCVMTSSCLIEGWQFALGFTILMSYIFAGFFNTISAVFTFSSKPCCNILNAVLGYIEKVFLIPSLASFYE